MSTAATEEFRLRNGILLLKAVVSSEIRVSGLRKPADSGIIIIEEDIGSGKGIGE